MHLLQLHGSQHYIQQEEMNMRNNKNLQTWVRLALLIAIQFAMRALGL